MRDIRYKWNSGVKSVGISNEVELPQFRVLGHRQRATVINLTTGNHKHLFPFCFLPVSVRFYTPFWFNSAAVRCLPAAGTGLWLQSVTPCETFDISGTKAPTRWASPMKYRCPSLRCSGTDKGPWRSASPQVSNGGLGKTLDQMSYFPAAHTLCHFFIKIPSTLIAYFLFLQQKICMFDVFNC